MTPIRDPEDWRDIQREAKERRRYERTTMNDPKTPDKDQTFSIADFIADTPPIFGSADEIRQDAEDRNESIGAYLAGTSPERRAQIERLVEMKQEFYDEMRRREAERN